MEDKICSGQNTVFIDQNHQRDPDMELNKLKSLLESRNRTETQKFILGSGKNTI